LRKGAQAALLLSRTASALTVAVLALTLATVGPVTTLVVTFVKLVVCAVRSVRISSRPIEGLSMFFLLNTSLYHCVRV